MTYLLDTHTLLWAIFSPRKLSKSATRVIRDPANTVSVSVVSFWEISLKYNLGRLELINAEPEDLPEATGRMGIHVLPVLPEEAATFHRLSRLGHNPFDRLIVWQAIQRRMTLITKDQELGAYQELGLSRMW